MAKGEIPHCTVCIVVCAIICHILVLIGNLETAQSIHAVGQSSAGWSDVGTSLGRSLGGELDHLMHQTVVKLTSTLDMIVQVETDIDYVLGAVANATDSMISMAQSAKSRGRLSPSSSLSERSAPKPVAQHSDEDDDEAELASLLQSSSEVCEEAVCSPAVEGELTVFLQGRVQMQLSGHSELGDGQKHSQAPQEATELEEMRNALHHQVRRLVERVNAGVHRLLEVIKPALLQIGKWLNSMGPKMQGTIEELSIVIDRVQKIIDQVMAKIAGPGKHSEDMLSQVFELFDVSGTGAISEDDIQKVSILYGITSLQHFKGRQLLKKYDSNKDSKLSKHEFALMVRDESIPQASTVILRTYSRKLAEVAGKVAKARMRDEVAHSVVQYFTLVCAKSREKVTWVSQALTNGSLPIEFVADVLKQFAHNADNPGIVDVMDVGSIAIKEMWKLDANVVTRALKVMADPDWWHSSGFDPADQPKRVKRVSGWVVAAGGHAVLLQMVGGTAAQDAVSAQGLDMLLHNSVEVNSRGFAAAQRAQRSEEIEALLSSETSAGLLQHLLGSAALARSGSDTDVDRVVQGGVKARPETLQFAHWLAHNASSTAQHFQHLCFDNAHTSSNAVDSLANQIKGVLGKTQNFLKLMERYSTPEGIEALEARVNKFVNHSLHEVMRFVDEKIDAEVAELGKPSLAQSDHPGNSVQGLWKDVIKFTKDLKGLLPTVIDDMKFAKREVSAVSANMLSIFPVFKLKGTPIFEHVKALYASIWIAYFVTFMVLTIGILFYGFWASGYFGGPDASTGEDPMGPLTVGDRFWSCARACGGCFDRCESSNMCFWSMILLAQVVVLFMFSLSTVLTLVSGLKAWISAGCGEVYMLNDNVICVEVMRGIQSWLSTFWSAESSQTPLESMCTSRTLMTCGVISTKLKQSAILTAGGSFFAAIFTAQMIFESARLHERARWRRMTEQKTVEFNYFEVDVS